MFSIQTVSEEMMLQQKISDQKNILTKNFPIKMFSIQTVSVEMILQQKIFDQKNF
jgi:hypothetical protein